MLFRHLKYNKHEVVLFHVYDEDRELTLILITNPKRFVDVETGEFIDVYSDNIKENYELMVRDYFKYLKNKCGQYR